MKADVVGIEPTITKPSETLQGFDAFGFAAVKTAESFKQPASVGAGQRCHIRNSADTEQITRHLDGIDPTQLLRHADGQDISQTDTSQPPIRRSLRRCCRMKQCRHRRTVGRNGVVIGHDHIHVQFSGTFKRFRCSHSVVDGDQEADSLAMKAIDHGRVEAIAVVNTRRDRGFGPSSQWFKGPQQQSGAGHSIGVVITADSEVFLLLAGKTDAFNGSFKIRKVVEGIGQLPGLDQIFDGSSIKSTPTQHGSER